MSTLETNNIGKYNGNNISFNDPLRFKNLTTSQIDALTGMVAGDTVFDSDLGKVKFYNGTNWKTVTSSGGVTATGGTITEDTVLGVTYQVHTFTTGGTFSISATTTVEYLIVGGGGGGGVILATVEVWRCRWCRW